MWVSLELMVERKEARYGFDPSRVSVAQLALVISHILSLRAGQNAAGKLFLLLL